MTGRVRTIDVHVGWVIIAAGLAAIIGVLLWAAAEPHPTPPPPGSGTVTVDPWPTTIDHTHTVAMPEEHR